MKTGTLLTAAGLIDVDQLFARPKLKDYGIQLWTVKKDLPHDPKGVLKQLAAFGYTQIESFEDKKLGMFWGMSPSEFKSYVDSLGMKAVSSHFNDVYKDSFNQKAADAGAAGLKFLILPSEAGAKTVDDYKKLANRFNECGEICKKSGLRFGYHNHDEIFKPINNQVPMDILLENTGKENVVFEIDLYWAVTAGVDPLAYMKKYEGRFKLCHVKDRIKNTKQHDASCILGEGSIDYSKMLPDAKQLGMEYFIVEQERYDNTTPMESAKADAQYMNKLNV